MPEYELRFDERLDSKTARGKLCAFAMWGEHSIQPRPTTGKEGAEFIISKGVSPDEIVERCREPYAGIPWFENLVGEDWTYVGRGRASIVDVQTGEAIEEMQGPGKFYKRTYAGQFQAADKERRRAVDETSFEAWQSAVVKGIASIESYLCLFRRFRPPIPRVFGRGTESFQPPVSWA